MSLSCSGTPRGFQDADDVGMPFIDDLLWGPDNDGKLIDLGCLVSSFTNMRYDNNNNDDGFNKKCNDNKAQSKPCHLYFNAQTRKQKDTLWTP